MKEIYLTLLRFLTPNLNQVPTDEKELWIFNQLKKIKWVDMDKGQLDYYENMPSVAFPCALIRVEIGKAVKQGTGLQMCSGSGNIRLAFNYVGNTAKNTPEVVRAQSLEYFDIVQAVYLRCQDQASDLGGKFDRSSVKEEIRPDGLKVVNIPFDITFLDRSNAA